MRPIKFLSLLAFASWAVMTSAQDHETPSDGSTFRDCSTCPAMVVIPAGTFLKGSPQDEPGRNEDRRNHDEDDLPGPGGSQRVSVRLTKGLNADWDDLKQLLYTLRLH